MSLGSQVVPKIDLFNGVRRYHCIIWEKIICIICMYLPETYTFIGVRMFPTMHYREFPNVEGIPHCYQGIFFQLLYTNQYFLNNIAQPRFYNTHTNTLTTEGSIFISSFCLSNHESGCLNNLKYLNE